MNCNKAWWRTKCSWASRSSKEFPEVPIEFRIPCGNTESRLLISLSLRILRGWMGTQDIPELLAVSGSWNSFSSCYLFTLSCSSWIWDKSWFTVVGLPFCCIDSSSILSCDVTSDVVARWTAFRESTIVVKCPMRYRVNFEGTSCKCVGGVFCCVCKATANFFYFFNFCFQSEVRGLGWKKQTSPSN